MPGLLDVLVEVFFSPEKGMGKACQQGLKKSLVVLFCLLLLVYWPMASKALPGAGIAILGVLFLIKFLLIIIMLLFYSFTIHGLANLFYITGGDVKKLMSSLCFSYLPFCFLPLTELLPSLQGNILAHLFLAMGLFFWMGCLAAFAVQDVYRVNVWQANLLVSLPTLAVLAVCVMVLIYLVTFIGHFL